MGGRYGGAVPGRPILFSDFNCPFCHATEERLAALGAEAAVEWRGVEHAPELPVPTAPANEALRAELAREADALASLAPELPIRAPEGKPNTRLAHITAIAMDRDAGPGAASRFRRAVSRAFWREGADIGELSVLRSLAEAAGLGELPPPGEEDAHRLAAWRVEWSRAGTAAVPTLMAASGAVLPGLVDQATLGRFLEVAGA